MRVHDKLRMFALLLEAMVSKIMCQGLPKIIHVTEVFRRLENACVS